MFSKEKYVKFQIGGRVGGGTYSVPTPMDIPKTVVGFQPRFIDEFIAKKPVVNKPTVDKSFLKDIEGHSVDMDSIYGGIEEAESTLMGLSDLDILSSTDKYKDALQKIQKASSPVLMEKLKNFKEMTKTSYETGNKKQNTGMFNYDSSKGIMVKDNNTGKVYSERDIKVAAEKLKNGEVQWLTNQDLFEERDTNPELAGSTEVSQRLGYGYGNDELNERVRKAFTGLGNTESGGKHSRAIDAMAVGDGVFVNDVMQGNKHSDNYRQAESAFQAAYSGMDKEMKDSLWSQATYKVAASGQPISNEAINNEMLKFFYATMGSKQVKSDYSESSVGIGKDLTAAIKGASSDKVEQIGALQSARNGASVQTTLEQKIGGQTMRFVGSSMGTVQKVDANGVPILTTLARNEKLAGNIPLYKKGSTTTSFGVKVDEADIVPDPNSDAQITHILVDSQGKVMATDPDPAKLQAQMKAGLMIKPVIAMNAYIRDKGDGFMGNQYDNYVSSYGLERIDASSELGKNIINTINGVGKDGKESTTYDERFKQSVWNSNDELIKTVVYSEPAPTENFRLADGENINIPKQYADYSYLSTAGDERTKQYNPPSKKQGLSLDTYGQKK